MRQSAAECGRVRQSAAECGKSMRRAVTQPQSKSQAHMGMQQQFDGDDVRGDVRVAMRQSAAECGRDQRVHVSHT